MTTDIRAGRLTGALLLAAMVLGLWNNFGLTTPIFSGAGWMQNASQMPGLFGASVLMGLATSALTLTAAITAWPVLRHHAPAPALGFLLLTAIVFATSAVEQANLLSLRSLSVQYAKHPGGDPVVFEILRGVVLANRNWIHYLDKLMGGASMLVLHVALFRSRLLPRFIPVFGMLAALIQMTGISLELFMQDMPMSMLAPIALAQLALCLALLGRGFKMPANDRPAQAVPGRQTGPRAGATGR